jgi:hypothetical protein
MGKKTNSEILEDDPFVFRSKELGNILMTFLFEELNYFTKVNMQCPPDHLTSNGAAFY